ncbi:MAG: cytochrome P450 [Micropepsaceae bacterium]
MSSATAFPTWNALPVRPPAPPVPAKDLSALQLVAATLRSNLSIWPDYAFDVLVNKRTTLGLTALLVSDPVWVRHVLITNASNYRRPSTVRRVALPVGGSGLFLAEGEEWRRQRRILAPSFAPSSLDILVPHFHEAALHLLRSLDGRAQTNLSEAFQDTALEAVFRALFSLPEDAARQKLSRLVRDFVNGPGRPGLFDGFARTETSFAFALGKRRRFQSAWFGEIDTIVAARRAKPVGAGHGDMLDHLLALRDAETGEALADDEVRDQCATMFFAGSETTARLMFWASYLLTLDRNEQARVQAEIAAHPPDRIRTLKDLDNWPRLKNLLYEALRLYPPLPHIMREAIGKDRIADFDVAPRDQIWASAWVMHRHRKFWENPTAFMPDRFAGKSAPWVQIPAYVPFGVGPRICIGLNFALAEAQIVLAHLLQRYGLGTGARPVMPVGRVTTEPDHEPMFGLTLR